MTGSFSEGMYLASTSSFIRLTPLQQPGAYIFGAPYPHKMKRPAHSSIGSRLLKAISAASWMRQMAEFGRGWMRLGPARPTVHLMADCGIAGAPLTLSL